MNEYELCSDIMTTEELDKFDLRLWNRKKRILFVRRFSIKIL